MFGSGWVNPYEKGYEEQDDRNRKAAKRKFQDVWARLKKKRAAGDKGEAFARMAGKGIGFLVGGSAGAGIGDLLAGGLYDLGDDRQEALIDLGDVSYARSGKRYGHGMDAKQFNPQLEEQNTAANTRHLTSPIKTYLKSLALAEMGTPATGDAGWENMSLLDKSTRSGIDMWKDRAGSATADSLNILDIVAKGDKGAKAADKTLLKEGFASNAGPSLQQYAPSRITTKLPRDKYPIGENVVDRTQHFDELATKDAMKLLNKKRSENREWPNFLANSVDADNREHLVNNFSPKQLENIRDNNLDWRKFNKTTGTGDTKKSIWDSVLGGLKKDPKEVIKTPGPMVKGGENSHQNIENLQNFLDVGGFKMDPNINEGNLKNIGPRLNIDEGINTVLDHQMSNVNIPEYNPVGENKIQDFVPNPIDRSPTHIPDLLDKPNLNKNFDETTMRKMTNDEILDWKGTNKELMDSGFMTEDFESAGGVEFGGDTGMILRNGKLVKDDYLVQNIQELEKNIPVINNQIDPIKGYKQSDLGIMGRDLKDRGYTDEEIERMVGEWAQLQYGNPDFTDRSYRADSSYNQYFGNYSDGQYHEGVIGDQGDWQSLNLSDGPSGAVNQFDDFDVNAFNPHYSPGADSKALEDMTQGKASDLLESVLNSTYDTSQANSFAELETLYMHGQMEGWSREELIEVRKLIREAKKLKGE